MTDDQVYTAVTSLLVPTLAVLLGVLPVTRARLDAFASTFAVPVTPATTPLLVPYLERTRRYRSLGGAAGWMLGLLLPLSAVSDAGSLGTGIAGYLAGALLAELRTAASPPPGPRSASLRPRRVADYVSPTARLAPPLLAAGALAVLAAWAAYPQAEGPGGAATAALTLGVAALAALLTVARRWIAARPRRVVEPGLVTADDAIRASSMQTISGAGSALLCLALSLALQGVDRGAAPAPLGPLLSFAAAALPLLALLCWTGLRHWGRPVRRPREAPAPA
jgi:hypothetical protein